MTSLFRPAAPCLLFVLGALALDTAPAFAAGNDGRAVAQCRAELGRHFAPGAIRSHRVGEISGTSRQTKVTLYVTAERRYRFECATDADGDIVTATFDPAIDRQLASTGN